MTVRKEGKMEAPWIGPTAHPTEEFECLDCFLVAVLNTHGRCERCDSNAVLPCQILEKTGRWITVGGAPFWVPTVPQYLRDQDALVIIPFTERNGHVAADARTRDQRKDIPIRANPE